MSLCLAPARQCWLVLALLLVVPLMVFTGGLLLAATPDGEWVARASMPTPRERFVVLAAGNGKLYAIGGFNSEFLTTVEEYDPTTDTWRARAPLPTPREYFAGAASNGRLYVVGGIGPGGLVATMDEYDPATDAWTPRAPMAAPRYGHGVASAANGKLYAIGGFDFDNTILATVEEYDPATDTWTERAPMPSARGDLGAAAGPNGRLYAVGGFNSRPSNTYFAATEEYDPGTNRWVSRAAMPTARYGPSVTAASNGKLYAIGGGDQGGVLLTVEEYEPRTDSWTARAPMPTARHGHGVGLGPNGRLYVIGGFNHRAESRYLVTVEEYAPPVAPKG
jgi:N-acetylneuraminic acid mutarotase